MVGEAPPLTVVRDVVHRRGEYSFTFEGPLGRSRVRFWGDVPAPREPAVEPALAVCLLPAMTVGGRLSLPAALSPALRRSLPDLQAALRGIAAAGGYVSRPLRTIAVEEPHSGTAAAGRSPEGRVGLFFSGGVDSWATLLRTPEVTDLIYIHGFDIPLERADVSATVERRLAAVAKNRGLRLHVVRTDLRETLDRAIRWEVGHGPTLAAAALLFAPLCGRVLIGSGVTYAEPVRRGSHPLVDPLWSTEACRIVNDGSHLSRAEKVELIAGSREALGVLRVCWMRSDEYNCGRCEKCLRTMVALEAVGALDRCPTFEEPLDLDAVAALTLPTEELLDWWEDNLRLASRGGRPELAAAVETCVTANRARFAVERDAPRAAAEARAAGLSQQLDTVLGSRSWRLTAPLRRAAAAARRLIRPGGG